MSEKSPNQRTDTRNPSTPAPKTGDARQNGMHPDASKQPAAKPNKGR
jgi:hypothetical protein